MIERRRPGRPSIVLPPEVISHLGKISDRQLADKAGVSVQTIVNARRKSNIPAFVYQKDETPTATFAQAESDLIEALKRATPTGDGMVISYADYAKIATRLLR
jgi:hypothetical protein